MEIDVVSKDDDRVAIGKFTNFPLVGV